MEHENKHGQPIVGSAEPLTPEETRDRLRELEAWGVDLSLVRASLERTPTKRVTRMIGSLELATKLRRAYVRQVSQMGLHD
jgi:hypothetical protein